MWLWPSWEASLRLVAPPGEGKTFRALLPILRQHPGPPWPHRPNPTSTN